jgi:thymidylate synthase (FAD)
MGETSLAHDSHTQEQAAEIAEARARTATTLRPTVPGLEAMLFQAVPILDHGFVRVIDYMGDDSAIVQAARVSYGRGTKRVQEDAGLIRYLMRHRHTTPFEMCAIKFHVKLPLLDPGQGILHPLPRTPRRAIGQQPAGTRRHPGRRRGGRRAESAARRRRTLLRTLRIDAE